MLRILPIVLLVALVVYALVDCLRTPDDEMPANIPKPLWVILVVIFPLFGPVAWIVASRVSRARTPSGSSGGWSSPATPAGPRRSGPLAPDDDPEFLFRLEQQRRRQERERRAKQEGAAEDEPAQDPEDDEDQAPPARP